MADVTILYYFQMDIRYFNVLFICILATNAGRFSNNDVNTDFNWAIRYESTKTKRYSSWIILCIYVVDNHISKDRIDNTESFQIFLSKFQYVLIDF